MPLTEDDLIVDPEERARRRADDLDALAEFGIDGRDPDRIALHIERNRQIVRLADDLEAGRRDLESLPSGARRPVLAELASRRRGDEGFERYVYGFDR